MDGSTGCHKALCNFESPEACTDSVHTSSFSSSEIEHYSFVKKKFYLNWQGRSQYFSLPHVSSNGLGNLKSAQFVGSGTGKGGVEECLVETAVCWCVHRAVNVATVPTRKF